MVRVYWILCRLQ